MPMRRVGHVSGFTLLEVMVTLTIFAILVTLTVPTMSTWIANAKVRSVADALQNGIRLAQAESLRRSRQVVFSLTTNSKPQNGFTASANGNYWAIAYVPAMTDGTDNATFIEAGVLSTAGANVQILGQAEICFNSVGRLVANNATGVAGGNCSAPVGAAGVPPTWSYDIKLSTADHPLRVQVGLGGQVHLCDPSQTLSPTNPYGC
jgi:type IV fimbrial biogenesis protein FimT